MGRRRGRDSEKLPPYVYLAKGRYILRRYDPTTRKQREQRLCAGNASLAEVWQAYEALSAPRDTNTFRWLTRLYLESPQAKQLAAATRRAYRDGRKHICAMELTDGRLLGDIPLNEWTPPLVQRWQDRRGQDAPVAANREKSFISRVFNWGIARGHCVQNPAKHVPRIREHARTRYVTDEEYQTLLDLASRSGSPYLVPLVEIAYLCRARLAEVLDLERASLLEDGILLKRRKGSRDSLIEWTPRLRTAVEAAKALQDETVKSHYLFAGKDHGRLRESTVQTAWQRLMRKLTGERFTLHDIKAKGITDTEENKLAASGHKDPKMLAIYDRLPGRVSATR
jgi:site-specific recombinase XerC